MRTDASVIRFFQTHRWLLEDSRFAKDAKLSLRGATRSHAATMAKSQRVRAELARREAAEIRFAMAQKTVRYLASLRSPEKAICHVFGSHCREALQVARCESGLRTSAQNGQYLGIFQMGPNERQTFGHGSSALEQAKAAHRYFVLSGRDWSPWSCKP